MSLHFFFSSELNETIRNRFFGGRRDLYLLTELWTIFVLLIFFFFCFVLFAAYHGALFQYFLLELQESFLNFNFIEEKGKEVSEGLLSSKSEQKNINPSSGWNDPTSMLATDYCKQKKKKG